MSLVKRSIDFLRDVFGFLSSPQRLVVWRLFQVVILVACTIYLIINLKKLHTVEFLEDLRFGYMILSWAGTLVALWLGSLSWWLILRTLGSSSDLGTVSFAHLTSNMAKYMPGYIWQFLGKAHLMRRQGISRRVLGVAMLYELVLIMSVGAVVAAIVAAIYPLGIPLALCRFFLVCGFIAAIIVVANPLIWKKIAIYLDCDATLNVRMYSFAVLAILIGWLCFGTSFWFLAAALTPVEISSWPIFLFSIVGSSLLSLIIPLLPGGLGVRESALTFLLSPMLGAGLAALVATLSRLTWFVSEVSAAGLSYVILRFGLLKNIS
jgi:hypothetical protein